MQFLQLLVSVGSFACPVVIALRIEVPDDVLRRQDCKNPCGFGGWLCCPSRMECFTDAASQAQCRNSGLEAITTQILPTPPRPATTTPETSITSVSLPSRTSTGAKSSTSRLRTSSRTSQSTSRLSSGDGLQSSLTVTALQSSTSTPSAPSPQNGLSSGAVAGAALGAIFGVGLIVLGIFLLYKRRAGTLNTKQGTGYSTDLPVACDMGRRSAWRV